MSNGDGLALRVLQDRLDRIVALAEGIGHGTFRRDQQEFANNVIEEACEIRDKILAEARGEGDE